jgi:hypothetical protein
VRLPVYKPPTSPGSGGVPGFLGVAADLSPVSKLTCGILSAPESNKLLRCTEARCKRRHRRATALTVLVALRDRLVPSHLKGALP